MVKFTKCCFCCSIKQGAYIIGCLHVFGLLMGFIMFRPLQITLDVFCGVTFLAMVYRDSEYKRLYYFAAYCVYAMVNDVIFSIFIADKTDEINAANMMCNKINE